MEPVGVVPGAPSGADDTLAVRDAERADAARAAYFEQDPDQLAARAAEIMRWNENGAPGVGRLAYEQATALLGMANFLVLKQTLTTLEAPDRSPPA
jgi:hypothetical protein